jgi:hypothetical protein
LAAADVQPAGSTSTRIRDSGWAGAPKTPRMANPSLQPAYRQLAVREPMSEAEARQDGVVQRATCSTIIPGDVQHVHFEGETMTQPPAGGRPRARKGWLHPVPGIRPGAGHQPLPQPGRHLARRASQGPTTPKPARLLNLAASRGGLGSFHLPGRSRREGDRLKAVAPQFRLRLTTTVFGTARASLPSTQAGLLSHVSQGMGTSCHSS